MPQARAHLRSVRIWNNKPTLHISGLAVYACFCTLTGCTGGRFHFDDLLR